MTTALTRGSAFGGLHRGAAIPWDHDSAVGDDFCPLLVGDPGVARMPTLSALTALQLVFGRIQLFPPELGCDSVHQQTPHGDNGGQNYEDEECAYFHVSRFTPAHATKTGVREWVEESLARRKA
jgi:hypothetical protein